MPRDHNTILPAIKTYSQVNKMKIILTENQFELILSEQIVTQPSDATQTMRYDPLTGKKTQSNPVKPSDYGLKEFPKVLQSKGMSMDEFVEKLRQQLYSPAGIAIDAFLSTFGVPEIPMVAYSGLLIWDINQSFSGDIRWGDIFFDLLGVLTAGLLMGEVAASRLALKSSKSIGEVIKVIKSTKLWGKILPYLKKLVNGSKWLIDTVSKGLKWLSNKLGLSLINKVWTKISTFIEKMVGNIVSYLGASEKISKSTAVAGKTYAQQKTILGTVEKGVDTYKKIKGDEKPKIDLSYKPTEDEVKKASQIDFSN